MPRFIKGRIYVFSTNYRHVIKKKVDAKWESARMNQKGTIPDALIDDNRGYWTEGKSLYLDAHVINDTFWYKIKEEIEEIKEGTPS